MASQPVGTVYVEIEARLEKLRSDLEQAKQEARSAGDAIGGAVGGAVEATSEKTATLAERIKQNVAPVKQIQTALTSTLGIVTSLVASFTAIVGLVGAVAYGIYQWATSAERAARAARETSDQINSINRALIESRVRAEAALLDPESREAHQQRLQEIRSEAQAKIDAAREASAKIGENELKDRIASFRRLLNDPSISKETTFFDTEQNKRTVAELLRDAENQYRVAYGQTIPQIQREADAKIEKERRDFSNEGIRRQKDQADARVAEGKRAGEELRKQAEKDADLEFQNWERKWAFMEAQDKDAAERKKKDAAEIAEIQQRAAAAQKDAARYAREVEESMKRTAQTMIDAVEQFRNLNQGGRIGQSDAFLSSMASNIAQLTREVQTVRRQQVGR